MAKRIASLMVALLAAACSGTTGTSDPSGGGAASGGTSSGGVASGGTNSAGTNSTAGKSSGGSVSSGGSGSADERCPAKFPMGMCDAEEADLSCQYDRFTGCLCYAPPGVFAYCQQVDTMCTLATGNGGSAGTAGAADAGSAGIGGISTKIAIAPTPQVCTCSSGSWACTF